MCNKYLQNALLNNIYRINIYRMPIFWRRWLFFPKPSRPRKSTLIQLHILMRVMNTLPRIHSIKDKKGAYMRNCKILTSENNSRQMQWHGGIPPLMARLPLPRIPCQSSPPGFQISDKAVWPSGKNPGQEVGKNSLPVLIVTVSVSCCRASLFRFIS